MFLPQLKKKRKIFLAPNPLSLLNFLKVKGLAQTSQLINGRGTARMEPLTLGALWPAPGGALVLSVRVQIFEGPCSAVPEGHMHTPSRETPHVLAP